MTEATPTLIDFNTICTVNIVGITEAELEHLFQYAYPEQFTKILYDNGNAIITCSCHWTALYFYLDYNHHVNIAWHEEDGQTIDPTTIPVYISNPEEDGDESENKEEYHEREEYDDREDYDDRYGHDDLCRVCGQEYVDYSRCEHCDDMNRTFHSSQRRPIRWLI